MERDTKHFMISVGFGDDGFEAYNKCVYEGACNKRRLCQSLRAHAPRISINEIKSVDWDKAAAISNRFKYFMNGTANYLSKIRTQRRKVKF